MSHQDWNPVIIRKKPPSRAELENPRVLQAALREGKVETVKKQSHPTTTSLVSARKMEKQEEEGNFKHERIPEHLRKSIIKARTDNKLTQAQLAQKINEKPQIIQDYEKGNAIPSPQILSKLSRVLGVQLKK